MKSATVNYFFLIFKRLETCFTTTIPKTFPVGLALAIKLRQEARMVCVVA